jgi:hypothetical protein
MRRNTLTALTLLAASWTGAAAAQSAIGQIRLTLEPTTYRGPCPVRLRARIVFESNFPTRVYEDDWGWNFGRLAPHSWDVPGGHLRTSGRETTVDTTLTLPRAGDTGGLLHEGSVFVIMSSSPAISNTVRYSVSCVPTVDAKNLQPAPAGPTIALRPVPTIPPPGSGIAGPSLRLPDLVVSRVDPVAGVVVVANSGAGPAGPSELLVRILCVRDDGVAERCAVGAVVPMTSEPIDRTLGGLVYVVPALPPGAPKTFNIAGWSGWGWRPGKYEMEATVDVRNRVAETNESNNVTRARFAKP